MGNTRLLLLVFTTVLTQFVCVNSYADLVTPGSSDLEVVARAGVDFDNFSQTFTESQSAGILNDLSIDDADLSNSNPFVSVATATDAIASWTSAQSGSLDVTTLLSSTSSQSGQNVEATTTFNYRFSVNQTANLDFTYLGLFTNNFPNLQFGGPDIFISLHNETVEIDSIRLQGANGSARFEILDDNTNRDLRLQLISPHGNSGQLEPGNATESINVQWVISPTVVPEPSSSGLLLLVFGAIFSFNRYRYQ